METDHLHVRNAKQCPGGGEGGRRERIAGAGVFFIFRPQEVGFDSGAGRDIKLICMSFEINLYEFFQNVTTTN